MTITAITMSFETRGSYLRKIHRMVSSSAENGSGDRIRRRPMIVSPLTMPAMAPKTQNSRICASTIVR
jgi:hypothetical protein